MFGTEPWFQHKGPDGTCALLRIEQLKWMTDEDLERNVRANVQRRIPRVFDRPDLLVCKHEPLAIVAGGPSLNRTIDKLREFKNVMAVASTHDHLSKSGVQLTYALVGDGMPTMADYLRYPQQNCTYLFASQLDPACFDAVEGCPVELWHWNGQVPDELFNGEYVRCGGASTTLIALQMALLLGYQHLHFFGFDCCYGDDTHAYEITDRLDKEMLVAEIGENSIPFTTDMSLCTQAAGFFQFVASEDGAFMHSTIHGGGMVAAMAREGNDELKARVAVAD